MLQHQSTCWDHAPMQKENKNESFLEGMHVFSCLVNKEMSANSTCTVSPLMQHSYTQGYWTLTEQLTTS